MKRSWQQLKGTPGDHRVAGGDGHLTARWLHEPYGWHSMAEQPGDGVLVVSATPSTFDLDRKKWGFTARSIQMWQRVLRSPYPNIHRADLPAQAQAGLVRTDNELAMARGEEHQLTYHFSGDVGLQV